MGEHPVSEHLNLGAYLLWFGSRTIIVFHK